MNHDFDGQMEAEDFLGLEGEVNALTGSFGETEVAPPPPGGELGLGEGWLLELDAGGTAQAQSAPAAAPYFAGAEQDPGDYASENGAPLEGEAGAEGLDYEGDEFEEELVIAKPARSRKLVAVGFAVGIAIAGGLYFSDRVAPTNEPTDLVARVNPTPPVATPVTEPVAVEPVDPTPDDTVLVADPLDETSVDVSSGSTSTSVLDDLLATDSGTAATTTWSSGAEDVGSSVGLPVIPDLGGLDPSELESSRTTSLPRSFLSDLENGVEQGDVTGFMEFHPVDTGLIWTGMEVPFDAIAKPGRLLTPGVGTVRATMISGESFEGQLFAVGGQRVWIEVGAGRIGLDGERVSTIERLVEDNSPAGTVANALPGLRVRVRTAGGVLYGQIKSREGNRVTILTDKGGRISLVDPVIEPIGRVSELVLKP